jgi:hypothetical protein
MRPSDGRRWRSAISVSDFREGALTVGPTKMAVSAAVAAWAARAAVPFCVAVVYALGNVGGLDHIGRKREPDRLFCGVR